MSTSRSSYGFPAHARVFFKHKSKMTGACKRCICNRPFSKMAAENSNRSILKMCTSTGNNTFTIVTLPMFSISWCNISWKNVCIIPPVILTSVNFSIFNLRFLGWYYTWNAETWHGYYSKGVLSSAGIRFWFYLILPYLNFRPPFWRRVYFLLGVWKGDQADEVFRGWCTPWKLAFDQI